MENPHACCKCEPLAQTNILMRIVYVSAALLTPSMDVLTSSDG